MIRFCTFLMVASASLAVPSLATEVTFDHGDCLEETGRFASSTNNDDLTQSAHQLMLCLAELSYRTKNMSPTIDRDDPGDKYYKVWPTRVEVEIGDENASSTASGGWPNIPVLADWNTGSTFSAKPRCRGPLRPVPSSKNESPPSLVGFVFDAETLIQSPEQQGSEIKKFVEAISKDPTLGPLSPGARMEAIFGGENFQSGNHGQGSGFENIYADFKPVNPYANVQVEIGVEDGSCAPNREPWVRGPFKPTPHPKYEQLYMFEID